MSGASTAERARGPGATGGGRVLVIGLGNPILGDDGVGWAAVEAVAARLPAAGGPEAVEVDCLAVGGLALMERLVGVREAILVDAVVTGGDPPGTVRVAALADVPSREPGHLDSPHDVTLRTALEIGRALGAAMPDDVTVVTVEVPAGQAFGDPLSEAVGRAVPIAADCVLGLLDRP